MACVVIPLTGKNLWFAHQVAQRNEGATVQERSDLLVIEGPTISITREMFNRAFPDAPEIAWKALLVNRQGRVVKATDDEIVVTDESPEWTYIKIKNSLKAKIDKGAKELGMTIWELMEKAVDDFMSNARKAHDSQK